MSILNRKIAATLAGTAFAATAVLAAVPAATASTASTASVDHRSHGEWHYKVVFDYLHCYDTEDEHGYDEVYMKFNHHKKWGPKNMDEGDHYSFHHGWKSFKHDFTLSLWDDDYGSHDSKDDYLGDLDISTDDAGEGWHYGKFTDNGAHYELKYKVEKYWK